MFLVTTCTAPGAPGRTSKTPQRRICLVDEPSGLDLKKLCGENRISLLAGIPPE